MTSPRAGHRMRLSSAAGRGCVLLVAALAGCSSSPSSASDDPAGGTLSVHITLNEPGPGVPDGEPPPAEQWNAHLYRGEPGSEAHLGQTHPDASATATFAITDSGPYRVAASTAGSGCPYWSGFVRLQYDGRGDESVELPLDASCAV